MIYRFFYKQFSRWLATGVLVLSFLLPMPGLAAAARPLNPTIIFFSPAAQTVIEGSTFDVSVFLNTNGGNINAVDLTVTFPPKKLSIVHSSAGTSLIQVWVKAPTYSNTDGVAHFLGVIPNGVSTKSGLITTLTFKAIETGDAPIAITPTSQMLANDGLGTQVPTQFGRSVISIVPKAPEGVRVFSDTHPFESQWSNNTNAVIGWDKDADVTDFSYLLDDKPNTVPDDIADTTGTQAVFSNLKDGLWYFHIKAHRKGVWGGVTQYLLRIDTNPPAQFIPTADYLAEKILQRKPSKALISFFTTDALSGVDHYEVAVIDKAADSSISPVFVQTESPYQLPVDFSNTSRVIVRAFDRAGNIRDASIDVVLRSGLSRLLSSNVEFILLLVMTALVLLFVIHYLFGHRILEHLRRIWHLLVVERALKQEERTLEEEMNELHHHDHKKH